MTLSRILEDEVMDTAEEALDYDTMDHSAVNTLFAHDFLAVWKPMAATVDAGTLPNGTAKPAVVLDLGTGTAQIPIEICRQDAEIKILAVDLATNMLELARYNIEAAGMRERIHLACVDAKGLPYEDETFVAVVSNSIVHHIPEPRSSFHEAVRVTASGGLLFFRDLLRPETLPQLKQLVDQYAGDATDRQQKLFTDSLQAALTLEEVRAMVAELGFEATTVQATSDRHWTWCAVKPAR